MSFDLARLCAEARETAVYVDKDDAHVTLFYSHPTPGKLGACFKIAGVKLGEDGQPLETDGAERLIGLDVAAVSLARLCIEEVVGVEVDGPLKEQSGFGIPILTEAWTEALDRNALYHLGQHLLGGSKASEKEGKDSEPSPSSATSAD